MLILEFKYFHMKKQCCLFLLFIMWVPETISQTPANSTTEDGSSYDIATNSTLGIHNFGKANTVSYDEIDGSPYFFDDFVSANALLANGLFQDSLLLNYDLATLTFISKNGEDSEFAIDSRSVAEYRLFRESEEFLFKRVDPKYPDEFYEILYDSDDAVLYKKEAVKLVKGEELGITKSNDRFFKEVRYYVKTANNIERVKLKKKFLWKYFDTKQQKILDEYLAKHKIKLKKEKDFKRLFSVLKV